MEKQKHKFHVYAFQVSRASENVRFTGHFSTTPNSSLPPTSKYPGSKNLEYVKQIFFPPVKCLNSHNVEPLSGAPRFEPQMFVEPLSLPSFFVTPLDLIISLLEKATKLIECSSVYLKVAEWALAKY